MFQIFSVSGTGIAQSALDSVLATWGVPGIVAVFAAGAVVWWTRATSGIRAEHETTIARQDTRIDALVAERDKALEENSRLRESYLAVKYPLSGHRDIAQTADLTEGDPLDRE